MNIIFAIIIFVVVALLLAPLLRAELPICHKKFFSAGVILVFFAGSFALYHQFGAPEILPLLATRDAALAQLKGTISQNSAAVQANPKNVKAWAELGDAFMETGQYTAAQNAYKQAVKLTGNPALILAFARAQVAAADGKVTDEAKKSVAMVLLLDPQNAEARYYNAVRLLQDGNNAEAMKNMKMLYQELPDSSPVKAMINRQIGRQ